MSTHIQLIFAGAGLLMCLSAELRSQDSLRIVILSERVGQEIDAAERERFHLFPQIQGFRKAMVLRAADGKFFVRFDLIGPDTTITEKLTGYSEAILLNMAEKINHFEGFTNGTYVWGSDRASLKVVGGETFTWKDLSEKVRLSPRGFLPPPDLLPFWNNEPPERSLPYPQLSARAGISTSSADLGVISQLVASIEAHYRTQDYYVSSTGTKLTLDPPIWFCLGLDISPAIGLTVEASKASGESIDLKTVAASVVYHPPSLRYGAVRPFVGAGLLSTYLSVGQVYLHTDRISPVDTIGGYYYLGAIGIEGKARKTGGMVTVGFELCDPESTPFGLQAFAKYLLISPITVRSSLGETGDIRLKGFNVGASLSFYF